MHVLLTGAFGNIGESTLVSLLEKEYLVRCFDIETERNQKKQKSLSKMGRFETAWGEIRILDQVQEAVKDVDCIIHLAGIIPPLSEVKPDLARSVNIQGTRNIVQTAEEGKPKLIFASSVSLYGPTMHLDPPRKASDPVSPTDTYTHTKAKCEEIIRSSKLPWTILRFAAAPPIENIGSESDMSMLFEIPLNQRIEFVHTRDVGLACANTVEANTHGMTLLIGGGQDAQMYQREFVQRMLNTMGLDMPPESAFRQPRNKDDWYYTDWLDTEESQKLLGYQRHSFEDFLQESKKAIGVKRHLAGIFKRLAMRKLLAASKYYVPERSSSE
ncbi:MAG: NAD(P)-dependent oxidoreductase [Candidatus Thorarchaeota archaeon]|nr:NAD(P)-dependent oxidoreductase [Candidatus Thorarchaeota archaeon]